MRAIWLLLAGCVLVALAAELAARVALDRFSKVQRRTAAEYRLARDLGRDGDAGRVHLLVVGNSLLDEGVQFDRVQASLGQRWDARRFVVEQTEYFDWYYGIRRLLAEGARPDVIVVVLTPSQWVRPDSRGDYTAQYLMSTRDVAAAARDLGLNATQRANLFAARLSKFWGARAEIRNFVLGHLMPDLIKLTNFSMFIDPTPIVDDQIERAARSRIARLNSVIVAHGGRLVVLVPPVLDANDGAPGLTRAARAFNVPVIRPVSSGTFSRAFYRDNGYHLTAAGAAMFTDHVVRALRDELQAVRATPSVIAAARPTAP